MSYESISFTIDVCNSSRERYQGYHSSSVTMLKNSFSNWHDDVGTEANKSLKMITDVWYKVVTDGFGNAYNGAQSVKNAYATLKAVKQRVQNTVTKINGATAGINQ